MKRFDLNSGASIPAIGYGTWKLQPGTEIDSIVTAINNGYRHIDCAYIYQNENQVGSALKTVFGTQLISRQDIWLTSKLWNSFHYPESVEPACRNTLEALQVEYLDLYLMHWPLAFRPGTLYPITSEDILTKDSPSLYETWEAMQDLITKGLVKNIGVSNFSVETLKYLLKNSSFEPAVNQIECHPYLVQSKLYQYCQLRKIHITAYSPLGSLDRPVELKSKNEPAILQDPIVNEIALNQQVTPGQVLISWNLQQGRSVLAKSEHANRMIENIISENIILPDQAIIQLNNISKNIRYVNPTTWFELCDSDSYEDIWD